jgi:PIN domain nuclease of toxin-antitoxin system
VTGYLLDTNVLLWMGLDDEQLSSGVRARLREGPRYVSLMSPTEIAIKASIGKLNLPAPFQTNFGGAIRAMLDRLVVDLLPLDLPAIENLRHLPLHHRDPFDRIIIAQAFAHGLAVATRDRAFFAYDGLEILEV